MIFTDVPGVITSNVGIPIGTSDYSFVSAVIREQVVPEVCSSRKIYLKSQGNWDGILRDLSQLNWPHYYHQDDPIEPLSNIIVEILDRRIPSRAVTSRNKDKAWFNNDCKLAYLQKQDAYNLWMRNRSDLTWNSYVQLRSAAQEVYTFTEREFNHGIKETLRCYSATQIVVYSQVCSIWS